MSHQDSRWLRNAGQHHRFTLAHCECNLVVITTSPLAEAHCCCIRRFVLLNFIPQPTSLVQLIQAAAAGSPPHNRSTCTCMLKWIEAERLTHFSRLTFDPLAGRRVVCKTLPIYAHHHIYTFVRSVWFSVHQRNCVPSTQFLRCTKNQTLRASGLNISSTRTWSWAIAIQQFGACSTKGTIGTNGLRVTKCILIPGAALYELFIRP